ncbi:MAG TPA: hypothetical protein VHG30_02385 [Microvirga sp.]|jgi:hypothetical protein|nr:hypothetical protein [Microvirga sp.]
MAQIYHIELVDAHGTRVFRRTSVRSDSLGAVMERALRAFRRARATDPGRAAGVRIVDGAGYEVFSASEHD